MLNSRDRSGLQHWLRSERGCTPVRKQDTGWFGARKVVAPGMEFVVDIATYDEIHRFEGSEEALSFDLVLDHHTRVRLPSGSIRIPSRSLLVLYKAKAAWDRDHRLQQGTAREPAWEQDKLVKDRADILALMDPGDEGPIVWDLRLLGETFRRVPFLASVFEAIPEDPEAIGLYGADPQQVRGWIETFVGMARP